jgi:hypothetical protein
MVDLGVLKRRKVTGLREIWLTEAGDFTPWLGQNINLLGETLGIDIEVQSIEAPVGNYSLDILAHDVGRDRAVVIENQITQTDHDHLGKVITYASGYDASTIIWIAAEFKEEHREAVDWLNRRTDQDTDFFGVVVEVLQIDDSRPAVNFRLVAAPNEWGKGRKVTVPPSERGERYREFYMGLVDELREKHQFTSSRSAPATNWCAFGSGYTGVSFNPVFGKGGKVRSEVYIDLGDADRNKAFFDFLKAREEKINAGIGSPLIFERLDDAKASRIALYRPGSIDDPPERLQEIHAWFVKSLLALKRVIGPMIPEALKAAKG